LGSLVFPVCTAVEDRLRKADDHVLRRLRDDLVQSWFKSGIGSRHAQNPLGSHPEWDKSFYSVESQLNTAGTIMACIGPSGTGKTQLAAALIRQAIERDFLAGRTRTIESTAQYTTDFQLSDMVLSQFSDGHNGRGRMSLLSKYSSPHLLVIDDLRPQRSPHVQEFFVSLMDARYRDELDTVLLTNLTCAGLESSLGPQICDRLWECGKVCEMAWRSLRRTGSGT